ncbi:MAG TPA: methyltransferase domain-containing protein [Polyangiaceae bacterium]|jgi:predicted methyltransferase|nr:methyltransferase domain-containing protein [Polyangiaceae bacterium]
MNFRGSLRPRVLSSLAAGSGLVALVALAACGGAASTAGAPTAPAVGDGAAAVDPATDARLRASIASAARPPAEVARDKYRHPAETLEFFGLRPDMTVVELWPGNGWYTAILAPFLQDKGKLVATNMDPNGKAESAKTYAARLAGDPKDFGKVEVKVIHPPDDLALGADGSADAVLTFRNFHNWIRDGIADKVLAASFRVLKPGGVFGVEEHRAKPDADPAKIGDTGYVPEAMVIDLAQKAGFRLEARSEVNANPNDTKDYPKGVWTLPPVLRLGDQDRAKYEAIGESDRMTLRFRKPQ